MKWKRWKLGALVSIALSLFVSLSGLAAGMGWKAFLAVLGSALFTHFGSFIKDHPVDSIDFDTEIKPKDQNEK